MWRGFEPVPIPERSTAQQIASQIRKAMLAGDLEAGQRLLAEDQLVDEFSPTSRSPSENTPDQEKRGFRRLFDVSVSPPIKARPYICGETSETSSPDVIMCTGDRISQAIPL